MTQQTKIEWTDFTVNFWEGCQKVGPGCDHCYAEARDTRFTGGKHWGPGVPRRKVKGGIAKLRKINRQADKFHEEHGHWPRVFCSSLSDIFDNAVDREWRTEAFKELTAAINTRPQLLTKRVGNVFQMIPPAWAMKWPAHVGLMITVVNQDEADRDIPKLLDLKARLGIPWVGLSMEPLLGPVDLSDRCNGHYCESYLSGNRWHDGPITSLDRSRPGIDWVIVGGESGHNARPTHPDWIRSLRDQCEAARTPFLFKQWGEWLLFGEVDASGAVNLTSKGKKPGLWHEWGGAAVSSVRVGKARAGRLLDGREWNGVPT